MPSPHQPSSDGAASDFFLSVQAKRAGKLKGEATSSDHADDILIQAWRWGASASTAVGSVQGTARRSYQSLTVVKKIDSSSTGLLAALATNDEIKEATLSMRKAGGEQQDYFKIKLQGARIVNVEYSTDERANTLETVSIAFTKVDVEYRNQRQAGGMGGAFTFSDEVIPG